MTRVGVVYVFAKEPVPGRVKTRLAGRLGDEGAAGLAAAMLRDALRVAAGAGMRLVLAADDPGGAAVVRSAREAGAELVAQGEGTLGERLARALERDPRAHRIALGGDVPDLPAERLLAAFQALERGTAAALGPAPDGGYHLLGLAAGAAAGFLRDPAIGWGSARALADTQAALRRSGAGTAALLAPWPDVDEPADLAALVERLRAAPGAAPATAAWLAQSGWPGAARSGPLA